MGILLPSSLCVKAWVTVSGTLVDSLGSIGRSGGGKVYPNTEKLPIARESGSNGRRPKSMRNTEYLINLEPTSCSYN